MVNKLQLKYHKLLYAAVRCAFISNHLFRRHSSVHVRTRTLHKCPYTSRLQSARLSSSIERTALPGLPGLPGLRAACCVLCTLLWKSNSLTRDCSLNEANTTSVLTLLLRIRSGMSSFLLENSITS